MQFTCRNGEEADNFTILESLGGGVALIDYDGDGLLDVFLPGGGYYDGKKVLGHPCKLYKNLGGFKFRDVTAEVGLDKIAFQYSHGAAAFDYDAVSKKLAEAGAEIETPKLQALPSFVILMECWYR